MNILIPIEDGRVLCSEIIQSIAMQSVKCNVVVISRPKADNKRNSEAECRNLLKKYRSEPYTIMLDSDVVFTGERDIEDLISGLEKRPDLDALAFDTKALGDKGIQKHQREKHVVIACVAVRSEVLDRITFRQLDENNCLCLAFNQDVKIEYLDHRQLREV